MIPEGYPKLSRAIAMQIELRNIHKRLGTTTVYVTHDQREAITMSDRIAVMNKGRIEQLDRPDALYARPRTPFVAGFIGESNTIPVEIRDGAVICAGQRIKVEAISSGPGPHMLMVRPERLRLAPADEPTSDVNLFDATVQDVVYQGDSFICYVTIAGGHQLAFRDFCRSDVLARLPRPGETLRLAVDPTDAVIVSGEA